MFDKYDAIKRNEIKSNCCEELCKNVCGYLESINKGKMNGIKQDLFCPIKMKCTNKSIIAQSVQVGCTYEMTLEYVEKEFFYNYCNLKNISNKQPEFPLGKIAGRFFRLPLNDGDCDGGLRVQGKYKNDSDDKPLITYITVVYNRIDTLPICMESIWTQDYDNIEYIIIDGGSTDGTVEFIKAHEEHIDYFVSQKDKGIYNAMNKGISLATGRYICFINSDDKCKEGAAKRVAEICKSSNPLLIAGRREMMDEKGKIIKEIEFPRYLIHKSVMFPLPIHHQSVYAQRSLFDELGEYDESYKFIADYKWEISCVTKYDRIYFADEELSIFSIGGLTGTANPIKRWDEWSRLCHDLFPQISYRQAEKLHYAIRHFWQYCEVGIILRSVGNKIENYEFAKTLYETIWYICQIELIYLKRIMNGTNENQQGIMEKLYTLFESNIEKVESIDDVLKYIDLLLIESTSDKERRYSLKDFEIVKKVKHEINNCYYLADIARIVDRTRRRKCKLQYFVKRMCAKTVFLTYYTAKKQFRREKK